MRNILKFVLEAKNDGGGRRVTAEAGTQSGHGTRGRSPRRAAEDGPAPPELARGRRKSPAGAAELVTSKKALLNRQGF